MQIATSKGKSYQAMWIDVSPLNASALSLQMADARPLPKIAAEFDGLTQIIRTDENQGDKTFTGYKSLVLIKRIGADVLIQMEAGT